MGELGVEAYAEARRKEYEFSGDAIALWWNRVALAVAQKTGGRIGLDTSTRMAMNAVFAPDREHTGAREPRPSSQGDELKSTLALQPFRLQFNSSAPDSRTVNCDRSRDSSFGCVGRNRRRCEDRNAAPNDRIAHPRQ